MIRDYDRGRFSKTSPALGCCAFQIWTDLVSLARKAKASSDIFLCVTLAQVLVLPLNWVPDLGSLHQGGESPFRRFSIVHCLLSAESCLSTVLDRSYDSQRQKSKIKRQKQDSIQKPRLLKKSQVVHGLYMSQVGGEYVYIGTFKDQLPNEALWGHEAPVSSVFWGKLLPAK